MSRSDPVATRRRAVVVAGHTGDVDVVLSALVDPDEIVREAAVAAAHRLDVLGTDRLASALTDASGRVRRRAAEIAASYPDVDLLVVLNDTDPDVAETAAWACGERVDVSDDALDCLIRLATGADAALVREAAVAALGAIGDPRGLPAILAGCRDKPAVRRRAVLALAPFEGPEVDAALERALTDRDWQVRQSAEDVAPT